MFLAALLLSMQTLGAPAIAVAAASDLQAALPQLVARFEKETGRTVRVTYGSSGNFFAQLQNGAPFDVFLSADIDYPARLDKGGLAVPGTITRYATGRIVLWTRSDSRINVSRGLDAAVDPAVRHIAIANPEHAPYGRAAVSALQRANLYETAKARFVLGENISQAAQFAQSGNAEVGIIALSLALRPSMKASGRYFEIPAASHPPIEQAGVVLKQARDVAAARQFLAFLTRADSASYLKSMGFDTPSR